MRIRPRKGSWILILVFIFGVGLPSFTYATTTPGLLVTVYNNFGYNSSPPLPEESGRPEVGTTTVSEVNQNFDSNPLFGMYEDFIVKYEGHITSPITGDVRFLPTADDGTKLIIDGQLIDNNWVDKGGGGNVSDPVFFTEGESKTFLYWFYENGGGAWTKLYWDIGNGWEVVPSQAFTQEQVIPTTTTIPRTIGAPENLVFLETDNGIYLDWDAPTTGNYFPERYAVSFSGPNGSYGMATGNRGDNSALNTEYLLPYNILFLAGPEGSEFVFKIRSDNDTEGLYSSWSEPVITSVTVPTTTTATTTTTTTTTLPPTTTTSTTTTTTAPPVPTQTTLAPTTTTTVPLKIIITQSTVPQTTTTTTTTTPSTTTTTASTTTTVLATTTTTTVPIVEIKEEMSQEEAVLVATNKEVLQEVSKEEAVELFNSIDTSEITEEQKSEIIDAVQNAPQEVKEAFEEEINVYADGFDDYVPVGSSIDVGTRRSLIAATTVLSTVAVAGATAGSAGSGGGSSPSRPTPSGSGSGGSDPNSAAKKEEKENEEDEEEVAEIEGPEGDEEENTFTRNSIFKYQEGTMKRTFSPWGFVKKFAKETAALAFTISGTVIVFATLSGDTRRITLIATSCAFVIHYINAMLKNDE